MKPGGHLAERRHGDLAETVPQKAVSVKSLEEEEEGEEEEEEEEEEE